MTKRILWVALVIVLVFPQTILAKRVAVNNFRDKVQKKIDTNTANIQYEPYYLDRQHTVPRNMAPNEELLYEQGQVTDSITTDGRQVSRRSPCGCGASEAFGDSFAANPSMSRYAIYKTEYKAELEDNVVIINGEVVFEVFEKGWTRLPLMRTDVGLLNVSVNRGTSFVTMQGGRYYLMLERPGRYTLQLEFLIKASREREFGPGKFSFEVVPAPISQFEFIIPEKNVEIFVEPAIKVEIEHEADKTVAWAVMPNTSQISARWTKAVAKETIKPVELEPKVYADTATYVSIGEGVIRCQSTVNYSILQAEVSSFRLMLPKDISILNVRGKDLRDWKVAHEDGLLALDVYLNFGMRGNYTLDIDYERSVGDGSLVASIPWVRTTGTERETGYFGIASRTNVELAVNKVKHASTIDVKELPSSIWRSSSNPILLAFKYLSHPLDITIDVTRHEEMPVLVAAIDEADFFTLHTKDGKILTRATYQVRNNVKQFLRLCLPKEATLWSTFVAGKPVKPAKDKNGSILVPLEKSRLQGENLTGFPVEVVFLNEAPTMKWLGKVTMNLPRVDIPVSQIQWQAYFPREYTYFDFGGDVKREKGMYRPLSQAVGLSRAVQGRFRGSARQEVDSIEQTMQTGARWDRPKNKYYKGYDKELEEIRNKGVLPIKISFPAQGQSFRFVKLLVTEGESPVLTLRYTEVIKKYSRWVVRLFWLLVLFFVFKGLRKFHRQRRMRHS